MMISRFSLPCATRSKFFCDDTVVATFNEVVIHMMSETHEVIFGCVFMFKVP